MINLYHILDLEKGATPSEIKKAFRIKARQYHPDLNPSAEAKEKFREVYMAYDILGDPDKRKFYDPMLDADDSDDYVRDWQDQAYEMAQEFSEMSYDDFRKKRILLHLWFDNPRSEMFMAIMLLILSSAGAVLLEKGIESFPDAASITVISIGGLMSFSGFYLFISYLRVQYNNRMIYKEESQNAL